MIPIDIPNAFTSGEVNTLRRVFRNKVVIEVGSLAGFSTFTIAQVARFVISIDLHVGYPAGNPSPTWELIHKNRLRYNLVNRVHLLQGPGQYWLKELFRTNPQINPDYGLFLDLNGSFVNTWQCLELGKRFPLIAVHDYGRSECQGATQAIDEFVNEYRPEVERKDTLVVMRFKS